MALNRPVVVQARLDPNSTNSFQLAFDGSPRTPQFVCNLPVCGTLPLEQHDLSHEFVRTCVEQLFATVGDFGQQIGGELVCGEFVDAHAAEC